MSHIVMTCVSSQGVASAYSGRPLEFATLSDFITIKGYIPRIVVAFLIDVGTGINTCLLPWFPVFSLTLTSTATCAMYGTIAYP